MTELCRQRIGEYLKEYVDVVSGHTYSEEAVIREGISRLIIHGIFTPEGLQKDILQKCCVLLPIGEIRAWVKDLKRKER